jgi:membrane protease YdiL (CAAX protease family)
MVTDLEQEPVKAIEPVWRRIVVFLLLTFGSSSLFQYLIVSHGGIHKPGGALLAIPMMWCPAIAAIVTQLIFCRSLRGMGWGWGKTRYQIASCLIPLAYTAVAYAALWSTGLAPLTDAVIVRASGTFESAGLKGLSQGQVLAIYLLIVLTVGGVANCVAALGEEIGWRGFLVPQLSKVRSYSQTAWISGLIWSAWHYPILLFGGYTNEGSPTWYALGCFTFTVLGLSFVFAWLRLKSGSQWTGMFLHASHNLFVQAIFTPFTAQTAISKYLVDEFGAALAIVCMVVGFLFWRRRSELLPAHDNGGRA